MSARLPVLDARGVRERQALSGAGARPFPEARVMVDRPMICVVSQEPAHWLRFASALIGSVATRCAPLVLADAAALSAGQTAALSAAGALRVVALNDAELPGALLSSLQCQPRATPALGLGWALTSHVQALLTVCIAAPASPPGPRERAFRAARGEFDLRIGPDAVEVARRIGEWLANHRELAPRPG